MPADEELDGFEHFQALFGLQLIAARVPETLWPSLYRAAQAGRGFPFRPQVRVSDRAEPQLVLVAERAVRKGEVFTVENKLLFGVDQFSNVINQLLARCDRHWMLALQLLRETGTLFAVPPPLVEKPGGECEGLPVDLTAENRVQFVTGDRLVLPRRRFLSSMTPDCLDGLALTQLAFMGGVAGDGPCTVVHKLLPALERLRAPFVVNLAPGSLGGHITPLVLSEVFRLLEGCSEHLLRLGPILTAAGQRAMRNSARVGVLPMLLAGYSCDTGTLELGGLYPRGLLQTLITASDIAELTVDATLVWPEALVDVYADLQQLLSAPRHAHLRLSLLALPDSMPVAQGLLALPLLSLNGQLCRERSFPVSRETLQARQMADSFSQPSEIEAESWHRRSARGRRQHRPADMSCPRELLDDDGRLSRALVTILHDRVLPSLRVGFDAISDKFTLVLPSMPFTLLAVSVHRSRALFRLVATPQRTFAVCVKEAALGDVATCDPLSAGFEATGFCRLGSDALRAALVLTRRGCDGLAELELPSTSLPSPAPPLVWQQRSTRFQPVRGPGSMSVSFADARPPPPVITALRPGDPTEATVPRSRGAFDCPVVTGQHEASVSPERLCATLFDAPAVWFSCPDFGHALNSGAAARELESRRLAVAQCSRQASLVVPCVPLLSERDPWIRFPELMGQRHEGSDLDSLLQSILPPEFSRFLRDSNEHAHQLPLDAALCCQLPSVGWLTDALELRRTMLEHGAPSAESEGALQPDRVLGRSWLLPAQIGALCRWLRDNSQLLARRRQQLNEMLRTTALRNAGLLDPSSSSSSSSSSASSSAGLPRLEPSDFASPPQHPAADLRTPDGCACDAVSGLPPELSMGTDQAMAPSRDVALSVVAGRSAYPHFFMSEAAQCAELEPHMADLGTLLTVSGVTQCVCVPVLPVARVWDVDVHVVVRRLLPRLDFLVSNKLVLSSKRSIGGHGPRPTEEAVQMVARKVFGWAVPAVRTVLGAYARRLASVGAEPNALARYCGILTLRVRVSGDGIDSEDPQLVGVRDGLSPKRFGEDDQWKTEVALWVAYLVGRVDAHDLAGLGQATRPRYPRDVPEVAVADASEPHGFRRQRY